MADWKHLFFFQKAQDKEWMADTWVGKTVEIVQMKQKIWRLRMAYKEGNRVVHIIYSISPVETCSNQTDWKKKINEKPVFPSVIKDTWTFC